MSEARHFKLDMQIDNVFTSTTRKHDRLSLSSA